MKTKKYEPSTVTIRIDIPISRELCDKYNGKANVKLLLEDIFERYFHEEYFEPDLVEEILNEA